ncbi:ABC transporter permease [Tomitella biformata]|uniref:ABC transporter permease n=1 Tax=Tomitella biformata TaxID=630403 RepID=UPI0004AED98C|nr:FtsX-like permease family protein [Tomitella biformata]
MMLKLTFRQAKAHAGRYLASVLAVVVAVGFVVSTLVLGATMRASTMDSLAAQYKGADAVVLTSGGDTTSLAERVRVMPGVRAISVDHRAFVTANLGNGPEFAEMSTVAADDAADGLRWQRIVDGAAPTGLGQALVSASSGIDLGAEVKVISSDRDVPDTVLEVVGHADLSGTVNNSGGLRLYVSPEQAAQLAGPDAPAEIRIAGDGRRSPEALTAALAAVAGSDLTVLTGDARAAQVADQLLGGTGVLSSVLLSFGAIAVVVAGMVIANTFAVLLASRTRELAMLRCSGVTAGQIRSSVRIEALAVGVIASALGVAAGVGVSAAVAAVASAMDAPIPLSSLAVGWVAVAVGLAVGIVTTFLAAVGPARAATKVSPLAALRPVEVPLSHAAAGGRLSLALGGCAVLLGSVLLGVGAWVASVLIACTGGLLAFIGVVTLGGRLLPRAVSAAGALVGKAGGPVGRLAAGNAGRNPRRTTATATALLIGITLTSTIVVGAGVLRTSVDSTLNAQYPVDVMVSDSTPLPQELEGQIARLSGVRLATPVQRMVLSGPGGTSATAYALGPDAGEDFRSDQQAPPAGVVSASASDLRDLGLAAGSAAELSIEGGAGTTVLIADSDAPVPLASLANASTESPDSLWIRLTDDLTPARQAELGREIRQLVAAAAPAGQVSFAVDGRNTFNQVLDTMLYIVGGLLSVAVLIALIGVGNTMALSVIERRRETGLLRALGLTRRGVRAMLLWEAALVAGVASLFGVVLGLVFGITGTISVVGSPNFAAGGMPWLQLVGIVVIGAAAGMLAAVLPARRATRVPPTVALAG